MIVFVKGEVIEKIVGLNCFRLCIELFVDLWKYFKFIIFMFWIYVLEF